MQRELPQVAHHDGISDLVALGVEEVEIPVPTGALDCQTGVPDGAVDLGFCHFGGGVCCCFPRVGCAAPGGIVKEPTGHAEHRLRLLCHAERSQQ